MKHHKQIFSFIYQVLQKTLLKTDTVIRMLQSYGVTQILLSTYNGLKFIRQQLESLAHQNVPISLIIRDDGSEDGTIELAELFQKQHPWMRIQINKGPNIGVANSFLSLLSESHSYCDFFAFCDQDDVWQANKIERAVNLLKAEDLTRPAMYFSRTTIVDQNLHIIGKSKTPVKLPSFENALVENIATGMTIVMNKKARELIISDLPQFCVMHDFWCYLVVSAFGIVIFDHESRVLYRQHLSNSVGVRSNFFTESKSRLTRLIKNHKKKPLTKQALEFYRIFASKLDHKKLKILERFLFSRSNTIQRLKYSFFPDVYRQRPIDNIILKLLIFLDWL